MKKQLRRGAGDPLGRVAIGRESPMSKHEMWSRWTRDYNGNFRPWVGSNYTDSDILILGYSHYRHKSLGNLKPSLVTSTVICNVIDGEAGRASKTFTKLEATFKGHILAGKERRSFWDAVAFYNYIQQFLTRPRVKPSPQVLTAAELPFIGVLRLLKPRLVACLGYTVWRRLETLTVWSAGPQCCKGELATGFLRITPQRSAIAICLQHPSTGFRYQDWYPSVLMAKGIACGRGKPEAGEYWGAVCSQFAGNKKSAN